MIFSSTVFLFVFLPCVLLVYYISPRIIRNYILLAFSLLFYWWNQPVYVILLLVSILINYLCGLLIERCQSLNYKKVALSAGIGTNIILLGIFKYTDFIITTINQITHGDISLVNIALPVGISFFTFQGMSYIIDIYRGKCNCCHNPFETALYISLFPQLIAGPIVKYNEVYAALKNRRETLAMFSAGITRFIFGLSKKVLLANVLGETTDEIFNASGVGIDCPTAWLGCICYTLQIYFDFSGYSDMAIGLGKMFGFIFPENFNYPYISTSITEFWRRWHISLSTWFRDYLYIPLGGSRKGNRTLHLLIVFFITGLWHGASWNFILWGLWYGVLLVIEKPLMKTRLYTLIPSFLKWIVTTLIVMLGWVLFRAENLADAIHYLKQMSGFGSVASANVHFSFEYYADNRLLFTLGIAIAASIPLVKFIVNKLWKLSESSTALSLIFRITGLLVTFALFAVCITYIINNVYNPFIYFRF